MKGSIAVINAGSSSIKLALHAADDGLTLLYRGQIEKIGGASRLKVVDTHGGAVEERTWPHGVLTHRTAAEEILRTGSALAKETPVRAVGHRIVHGGPDYATPVRIDTGVLEALDKLVPLAPLHQPHNLATIRVIAEAAPHLPQVACFDTAFHRSQPLLAQSFALPRRFTESGIRRYGFHGLSYEYIVHRLSEIDPSLAMSRLVIAHLGNGASLCAVHGGHSIASTMGFTAVDGLVMGTRSGALDPGVLLYLMDEHHMDARQIEDLIYNRSGLLGVSGISSDMRTLRNSTEPEARDAIELFVYRIVREIGSLAAAMGGVDGLVFTGGIGENDARTRAEIGVGCRWLGIKIDQIQNESAATRIDAHDSHVPVLVVPTDEERMIARHTIATLGGSISAVQAT